MELWDLVFSSLAWWDVYHTWRCIMFATYFDQGRFQYHGRMTKDEALKIMVDIRGLIQRRRWMSWIRPGVLMLDLYTWRRYMRTRSWVHNRLMVMMSRWLSTYRMHWEHTCFIWLASWFLWTRVPPIRTLSTYITLWTSSRSMSTTEGGLFGLPLFKAERGLYVDDEAGHG